MRNCSFSNLNLSYSLLTYSNNFDFDFRIENCVFDSFFSFSEGTFDLIKIDKTKGNVYFENSTFKMLSFFENILSLEKLFGILNINLLVFKENEVYSHILSIKEALNATINNTICTFTNNKNGKLYRNAGGAMRIYNVLSKLMNNVEVSFGFSVKTCFGIKIIDDSTRNTSNSTNLMVK